MKIAITIWNARVSPVFDVARSFVVLDIEESRVNQRFIEMFANDQPEYKASRLQQLGVDTLICGAISRYYARVISTHRIEIIPFIAGELDEIIKVFLAGKLPNPGFIMPGCCRNRRQHQKETKEIIKEELCQEETDQDLKVKAP